MIIKKSGLKKFSSSPSDFYDKVTSFYQLKDYADEEIDGYFYEVELQKVTKDIDSVFRIEKILKQRGRRGREEYPVK